MIYISVYRPQDNCKPILLNRINRCDQPTCGLILSNEETALLAPQNRTFTLPPLICSVYYNLIKLSAYPDTRHALSINNCRSSNIHNNTVFYSSSLKGQIYLFGKLKNLALYICCSACCANTEDVYVCK